MGLFRKKDVSDADRLALTDKQMKLLREQVAGRLENEKKEIDKIKAKEKRGDTSPSGTNYDLTDPLYRIIELLEKIEENTSNRGNLQEILEKIERLENIDRAYKT